MDELHLAVPRKVVNEINASLRKINKNEETISLAEIAKDALSVYRWMVDRMAAGFAIGAAGPDAKLIAQIDTTYTPLTSPQNEPPPDREAPRPGSETQPSASDRRTATAGDAAPSDETFDNPGGSI